MKRQSIVLLLLVTAMIPWTLLDAGGYLLRPGDLLGISVWGEDNLKSQVRVLPDGSISFPLAGRLNVRSKTTSQVESSIKGRLNKYIPDAQVSVSVISPDGSQIFVMGKVNKPGPVLLLNSSMTVTQALSLAGGLNKFACEDKIKILRNTGEGQIQGFVRYSDIESGEDLTTNYQLLPGDTIVVP
jgi:polysaccharide export outer membrane protein